MGVFLLTLKEQGIIVLNIESKVLVLGSFYIDHDQLYGQSLTIL